MPLEMAPILCLWTRLAVALQYGYHARLFTRVLQRALRASFAQRRQQGSSAETSTKGALQLLPAWLAVIEIQHHSYVLFSTHGIAARLLLA